MTLGERLNSLRKKRNWTMEYVSDKIGVAKSTYAGYESDYRQPPLETLDKLAFLFDTTTDYLLGRTEIPVTKAGENPIDLNELLKTHNIHFDGEPLTEEDKRRVAETIRMFIKITEERERKNRGESE